MLEKFIKQYPHDGYTRFVIFLRLCLWFGNMATNDLTFLPLIESVSSPLELGWACVTGGPKEYGGRVSLVDQCRG